MQIHKKITSFNEVIKVLAEAIDTGEYADVIDYVKKTNIEELGDIGIEEIVKDLTVDEKKYLEVISGERYQDLCRDLERYLNIRVDENISLPTLFGILQQLVREIISIEKNYTSELEEIALNVVLSLPEFEKFKQLVDDGELKIRVTLDPLGGIQFRMGEPEDLDLQPEEELDFELFDLFNDIDQEVINRKFANYLITGSAQNKSKLVFMIKEQLDQLDEGLFSKYLMIMAVSDFLFWVAPSNDDVDIQGFESLADDDGNEGERVDVNAVGKIFPILVHELVKGLMEYRLHFALPTDPDIYDKVIKKADQFKYEDYQLMLGSQLDKAVRSYFSRNDIKYYPDVVSDIVNLPNIDKQAILTKTPKGREIVDSLIAKYKSQYEEYEKERARYEYDMDEYDKLKGD